jgi:hypothetical protein
VDKACNVYIGNVYIADAQLTFDPNCRAGSYYYVNYNEARGELDLQAYGSRTIYVFKIKPG